MRAVQARCDENKPAYFLVHVNGLVILLLTHPSQNLTLHTGLVCAIHERFLRSLHSAHTSAGPYCQSYWTRTCYRPTDAAWAAVGRAGCFPVPATPNLRSRDSPDRPGAVKAAGISTRVVIISSRVRAKWSCIVNANDYSLCYYYLRGMK
jgi:hypothetical protein